MRIVRKCIECGHKRLVARGFGNKFWCEDCLYLADDLDSLVLNDPETKRKRIRWKMGEREDESKEPETRGI